MDAYQRSKQQTAWRQWVIAATAVAAIGVPTVNIAAGELRGPMPRAARLESDLTHPQRAARAVKAAMMALEAGDIDAVMDRLLLPRDAERLAALDDQAAALSLRVRHGELSATVAAHWSQRGWAAVMMRISERLADGRVRSMLRPIYLFNPAPDDPADRAYAWRLLAPHTEADPAIAPLLNADLAAVRGWAERWRG